MSDGLTPEEVHEMVDRVVAELLEAAGANEPPVDALALAKRHLGLEVLLNPPRGRGRTHVFERPEPTEERQQGLAAHAIGEYLKLQLRQRLGIEPGQGMMGESLPKLLAQRLLVPTTWLVAAARESGNDLLELKERFRTASHETIAWRLLDLPAPCIITIVDNDEIARRRSNAWRTRRELSPPERECQKYVSQYSRPRVVNRDGWAVQGWPVHQADWKREVLRSVVEEGEP